MLRSLGFGGDAIFPMVDITNVKSRLALGAPIYAHEFKVDMVCTYGFPPMHESFLFFLFDMVNLNFFYSSLFNVKIKHLLIKVGKNFFVHN